MHPNVNWIPQLSGLCSDHFFPFSAWPVVLHPVCMYVSAQLCWTLFHPMNCGSLGFSRQGYWYGLPFHPPGNLPDPGIVSPMAPTLVGRFSSSSHLGSPFNQFMSVQMCFNHQHSFVMPQSPPMYLLVIANLLDFDIAHCHIPINNTDFLLPSSGILNGMIYERHFRRVKRNICVEIRTQVILTVPLLYPVENNSSTKRTDSVLKKITHPLIYSFISWWAKHYLRGTADRMVSKTDALTLRNSLGEEAKMCTSNFTAAW